MTGVLPCLPPPSVQYNGFDVQLMHEGKANGISECIWHASFPRLGSPSVIQEGISSLGAQQKVSQLLTCGAQYLTTRPKHGFACIRPRKTRPTVVCTRSPKTNASMLAKFLYDCTLILHLKRSSIGRKRFGPRREIPAAVGWLQKSFGLCLSAGRKFLFMLPK